MLVLERESIAGGMGNEGIFIWRVKGGGGNIVFLEKRIKFGREVALYRKMYEERFSLKAPVQIHGLSNEDDEKSQSDGTFSVFMDYYPDLGNFKLNHIENEEAVAIIAKNICKELLKLAEFVSLKSDLKIFDESKRFAEYLGSYSGESSELLQKLKRVVRIFSESECAEMKVVSHNDLHFGNIWVGPAFEVKLIDFGLYGLNNCGAELHHFYTLSTGSSKQDKQFYGLLAKNYSSIFKVPENFVNLAACYYAIIRIAMRLKLKENMFQCDNKRINILVKNFFELNGEDSCDA